MQTEQKYDLELKIEKLKEQGRAYLKVNKVDQALRIFAKVLHEYPEDLDALLIVADGYMMVGDKNSAAALYRAALKVDETRGDINKRLKMLDLDSNSVDPKLIDELYPIRARAISRLIEDLTGKNIIVCEEDIEKSKHLLDQFLVSDSPGEYVSNQLEEIETLIPALIELNIRQAKMEGKNFLAESLQELLDTLFFQLEFDDSEFGIEEADVSKKRKRRKKLNKVLLIGDETSESPFRFDILQRGLTKNGFKVINSYSDLGIDPFDDLDLVIAHNPHSDQRLMKAIASISASNIPVIIDMDMDFETLSKDHPDYYKFGRGSAYNMRSYKSAIEMADVVCVPNEELKQYYTDIGIPAHFIPDGWDQSNHLWLEKNPERSTLNLGLVVLPGEVETVAQIRRAIVRVMREFPHTRLVINGDLDVYHLFDNVSDVRRLFLPPANSEDYPYLLAQFDILLLPSGDSSYYKFRSDRLMIEAGVRRIPWISNTINSALSWSAGGMLADTVDGWYHQMQRLIFDATLRDELGREGFQKALQRENSQLIKRWAALMEEVVNTKR
ncbi:MAG: hypothetical protein JEZ06_06150 [Anaerolineaceae bacterium]|nr:hypothetical protein [Anaerolineaceae bacterium]